MSIGGCATHEFAGILELQQLFALLERTPTYLAVLPCRNVVDVPHREKPDLNPTAADGEGQVANGTLDLCVHARFLTDFAPRGLLRSLLALDVTFRQHPVERKATGTHEKECGAGRTIPAHDAAGMSQAGHTPILRV